LGLTLTETRDLWCPDRFTGLASGHIMTLDYLQGVYQRSADVISVRKYRNRLCLEVDSPIFYPRGGGQESDRGFINGMPVVGVERRKGRIVHTLATDTPPKLGSRVHMAVDTEWRMLNSRYHTGGHAIASAIEGVFPELRAVAAHHYPGDAWVQFAFRYDDQPEPSSVACVASLILKRLIVLELPVQESYNQLMTRTIQIGEYPSIPCNGTHVTNTQLIKQIDIRQVSRRGRMLKMYYRVEV
jgi:alanyl-tRNA synthetase